ncbi:MAG: restriction endonuclease [Phycisphaerales bacterium]
MFESAERLWVVHISNHKRIAQRAQAEGFVCIGWTRIGNLSPYDTPEKLKAAYEAAFPGKSAASVRSSYGQVYRFAHEMQVGDPVVYPIKASRDVLIGRIAGDYSWSADSDLREHDYCNVRPVEWISKVPRVRFSQAALRSFGSFSSVSTADDHLDEVRAVLRGQLAQHEPAAKPVELSQDAEAEQSEDDAAFAADEVVQATKDYLIRRWIRTAQDFEEVVAGVFRALGYTAVTQQGTRDLGVDVIAHMDPLGVTPPLLKIQAKSGTSTIGAPAVKQLRGVLNPGEKGVLISLGGFSSDAKHTEQNDANLILIDADRFVDLFLSSYANLSPDLRHRFPLQQVYVVAP